MKKILLFLMIILCVIPTMVFASESEDSKHIIDEYISIYSEDLNSAERESNENISKIVPDFSAEEILKKSASGGEIFDVKSLLSGVVSALFKEVRSSLKIMFFIVALSILAAYLSALSPKSGDGVSSVANFACYAVICGICAASFLEVVSCGRDAAATVSTIAKIVVPTVILSLAATGAVTSAAVFSPMLLGIIEVSIEIIERFFIPILMLYSAMSLVCGISEKVKAEKMVQFLGKTVKWGLSALLTIFVSAAGLQSLSSGCADGLSVKLTKYAASNLIPVVGGILSETVETVMNCSVIIKNAVGITGIIIIVLSMIFPLVKIGACLIVFRLTAALVQPISGDKVAKTVSSLGDGIGLMFAIVASVTVMLIIILTIMLNAGSAAVMLGR